MPETMNACEKLGARLNYTDFSYSTSDLVRVAMDNNPDFARIVKLMCSQFVRKSKADYEFPIPDFMAIDSHKAVALRRKGQGVHACFDTEA